MLWNVVLHTDSTGTGSVHLTWVYRNEFDTFNRAPEFGRDSVAFVAP